MGCGGSKDGQTIHLALEAAPPTFLPAPSEATVSAFDRCEAADEKDLISGAKMSARLSVRLGAQTVADAPTLDEQVETFRAIAAALHPAQSNGSPRPADPLDAEALSASLADDLFGRLLEPTCPTPAVSKGLLFRILLGAIDALKAGGSVVDVPLPVGPQRQIIVGDTHGQLQDVLTILLTHGLPSATNRYIWNGDIADRGPHSCEIFALVLLFQLQSQGSSWITRGNHEARDINERPAAMGGGFMDEVLDKYDLETFELFQLYFKHLPLAVNLGGQILVLHGGLTREAGTTLETIRTVDHRRDIPQAPTTAQENVLFDITWSDPQEEDGVSVSRRGDDTITWGPDVTKAFLAASGLGLLVRSHQVPASGRGYGTHHDSKVLTVFSASNYAGACMNLGAVVIVPATGALSVPEHQAQPLGELRKAHAADLAAQRAQRAWQQANRRRSSLKSAIGSFTKASDAEPADLASAAAAVRASVALRTRSVAATGNSRKSILGSWKSVFPPGLAAQASGELRPEDLAESQAKLVHSILTSVRGRICKQRSCLYAALEARHAALCTDGQATPGGGLLPLSAWRAIMTEVLDLDVDWDRLPLAVQMGLAEPLKAPTEEGSPPPAALDLSLYPAVRWKESVNRFQVVLT